MPWRIRRRYIAVKIDSERTISERDFFEEVLSSILKLFGEYGASQAELVLVKYDPKVNRGVVRCSHKALDLVKASLPTIIEIGNVKATVHVLSVSGTLKALRRRLNS